MLKSNDFKGVKQFRVFRNNHPSSFEFPGFSEANFETFIVPSGSFIINPTNKLGEL